MSKFGLKVADKTIYGVKSANDAIDLIDKVTKQFLGGSCTQYAPICPICNEKLKDFQKHMNRPVGECVNKSCQSTIFPSDYIGKIVDIINEVLVLREEEETAKKNRAGSISKTPVVLLDDNDNGDGSAEDTVISTPSKDTKLIPSSFKEPSGSNGDIPSTKTYAGLPVIDW